MGPKGLADECMAKGYEIKVVPAKDPAVAKDVYCRTGSRSEVGRQEVIRHERIKKK
jgi:hypothetical protein